MVYTRFVEIGRVAFITNGSQAGKLVVIIDLIDQRRALVTGPCSGVPRKAMPLSNLNLTRFTIKIPHSARDQTVRKAYEAAEIWKKWQASPLAKRIALRKKRMTLTDFDRYKIKCLKQQKTRIVRSKFKKLKREQATA